MIVYDITRPETFNSVDKWFNEIREFGEKNIVMMMVGNKCDLKNLRQVENSKSMEKAQILGIINKFNMKNINRNTYNGNFCFRFI